MVGDLSSSRSVSLAEWPTKKAQRDSFRFIKSQLYTFRYNNISLCQSLLIRKCIPHPRPSIRLMINTKRGPDTQGITNAYPQRPAPDHVGGHGPQCTHNLGDAALGRVAGIEGSVEWLACWRNGVKPKPVYVGPAGGPWLPI